MTRKECLDKAAECVLQDRASQYGGPEDNFGRIAKLWSTYTGTVLDGIDVAMMMALLKVARIRNNKSYEDGYIDLAGYAACGAELAGRAEAYRQFIEEAGEEYKKLREQAEGGCCQNGKDHSPEEPEFKPGDAVEWNSIGGEWRPAVYLREFGDFGHCVVQLPDGRERIVSKADLRRPEANYPDFPDSSTEAKPKFKHGDKVQCRVELPSVSDRIWVDGEYVRYEKGRSRPHVVYTSASAALELVSDEDIRPAPKAEGCEALVEKDAPLCGERCEEFIPGLGTCESCRHAREQDAPQTPQELCKRIIDANPATFHTPSYAEEQLEHHSRLQAHKPTGEELAKAEEEDKDA